MIEDIKVVEHEMGASVEYTGFVNGFANKHKIVFHFDNTPQAKNFAAELENTMGAEVLDQ